jgi:alkaline phosphatase
MVYNFVVYNVIMDRRKFLKGTTLLSGALALNPFGILARNSNSFTSNRKKAKNIIFMISDGMSLGTLTMADLYSRNILGRTSNWMDLYHTGKVNRAMMDTASASSIVTDSAAASSSFGGGVRVKNGMLNVGSNGEKYVPIWQKFKKAGKKAGCVTTVTITHATPAGFCVNSDSRNAEEEIAEMYHDLGFDIMMGGGDEFFNPNKRADRKDLYETYKQKGYQILKTKSDLKNVEKSGKVLGVFSSGALPYTIDQNNLSNLQNIPSLTDMAKLAIDHMKDHPEGFVHQLAFDEAIKAVLDFAEKDGETLVIITTDHGNANPGIIYGADATSKFNSISNYKYSNEFILNSIRSDFNVQQIKEWIYETNYIRLSDDDGEHLLSFYQGLEKQESGLYNYKKLPYKAFSDMQKKHNNVGWISMDHSGDYVEVVAYGPGRELLSPFIKNTDLHQLMMKASSIRLG